MNKIFEIAPNPVTEYCTTKREGRIKSSQCIPVTFPELVCGFNYLSVWGNSSHLGWIRGGKNFSNLWWFNGLMNRHEMEWRWFVEQEKTAKNASNQSQWLEHVRIIPFTSLSLDLTGPTVPFPTHSSFIVNGVSSLSAPTCLVVAWRWEERPKPMMDL